MKIKFGLSITNCVKLDKLNDKNKKESNDINPRKPTLSNAFLLSIFSAPRFKNPNIETKKIIDVIIITPQQNQDLKILLNENENNLEIICEYNTNFQIL